MVSSCDCLTCLHCCFSGGWGAVCVQVCLWPRGSVLHGLPWQPEAQPEGWPRQPTGPGRGHCASHPLRWDCSLSSRCWRAMHGWTALPGWLRLLMSGARSRRTTHVHANTPKVSRRPLFKSRAGSAELPESPRCSAPLWFLLPSLNSASSPVTNERG